MGTELRPDEFGPFLDLSLPLVILDSNFAGMPANRVLINNIEGAFLATDYIITKRKKQPGHMQSAYVTANFDERRDGFFKAIRHYGMAQGSSVVHTLSPSLEGAYEDMKALIKSGSPLADCYFADNDVIALGAMRAFKEAGYSIPKDVAIIGFDNIPMSQISSPPLTTVHVPKQELGRQAVNLLLSSLNKQSPYYTKIEVCPQIVKRGSV